MMLFSRIFYILKSFNSFTCHVLLPSEGESTNQKALLLFLCNSGAAVRWDRGQLWWLSYNFIAQPWPQQWRSSWEMQPPLHHRQVSHGRSGRLSAFPVCHAERQLELWRQRALPCLHLSPVLAVVMLTWTTAWRNTQPGTGTTTSNLSSPLKSCRVEWSTTQCWDTPYLLQSL